MLCKNDIEDDIGFYLIDRIPNINMNVVFDVGANVGWWTFRFIQHYNDCQFYLFEPVSSLHGKIEATLNTHAAHLNPFPRVKTFRLALGDKKEAGFTTTIPDVTVNHLVNDINMTATELERVDIETLDNFCASNQIDHIDFLKVDCEGFDMKVILGARTLLEKQSIDFVEVEASLNSDNRDHVSLAAFEAILGMYGYQKFRILNQASPHNRPILYRADIVFISGQAAERYKK